MQTMAEHKYLVEETSQWKDFVSQLGDAAVKMDLLNVKPSHTVSLNVDPENLGNREASSRGTNQIYSY